MVVLSSDNMLELSDEEIVNLFHRQLPELLARSPELEPLIYASLRCLRVAKRSRQ